MSFDIVRIEKNFKEKFFHFQNQFDTMHIDSSFNTLVIDSGFQTDMFNIILFKGKGKQAGYLAFVEPFSKKTASLLLVDRF